MYYIVFILIVFSFCGCNSKEKEILNILKYWQGREMIFPVLQTKIAGIDTLYDVYKDSTYKIVHYVDSIGCTPCKLSLYEWTLYMKNIADKNIGMTCIFILGLKDFSDFEEMRKENHFIYPVMYDINGVFNTVNHLPKYSSLQTFLLDKYNKVVAIGDPVKNDSIQRFYTRIFQEKL